MIAGTTLIAGVSADLIELAHRLGKNGEQIGLISRTPERLKQYQDWLAEHGCRCEIFPADVTDAASIAQAFEDFAAWSQRLDRLIYNVGMISSELTLELTDIELQRVMGANFFGFANCFRMAYPMFKRTGGGHVIALSSVKALYPDSSPVAYSASKASLQIYISAIRRETQDDHIHFTELFLGQKSVGLQARNLTREEIVEGFLHILEQHPRRFRLDQSLEL
jgi:short-subunit dehydrogenase